MLARAALLEFHLVLDTTLEEAGVVGVWCRQCAPDPGKPSISVRHCIDSQVDERQGNRYADQCHCEVKRTGNVLKPPFAVSTLITGG